MYLFVRGKIFAEHKHYLVVGDSTWEIMYCDVIGQDDIMGTGNKEIFHNH